MKSKPSWLSISLLLALGLTALAVPVTLSSNNTAVAQTGSNPIVTENQNAGTGGWQLYQSGFTVSNDATGQIQGYASSTSVNKGDQLAFYVSVNPAQTFRMDIYRMGYYGGNGGRLMQSVTGLNGIKQQACPMDATTGLVECKWTQSYLLTVPTTWTTGVYVVKLTNAQNYQNSLRLCNGHQAKRQGKFLRVFQQL